MIQGIFYARFLPQEGTKIVAQSPPGCIVALPEAPNLKPPLLDFDIIQEYVIPRKAFFNRFLTVNSPDDKYSVLGFPVSIPNERYHRNEFLFNFGLVVESDVDQIPYERLVRRLAVTFAEMERQNSYLSSEGTAKAAEDGRRPIESLLEIIKEDLNNYGECMIPIDEANTLNMKLFPHQAAPPAVRGWHVPVPKMKLADIVDATWDLTLQKIIPHVDGVNDVRRVAWLADVSLPLAQVALRHLLYYDTVLLLDMFFFGSCYAPRPGIHDFIANRDGLVDECAAYVCLRPPSPSAAAANVAAAAAAVGSSSSTTSENRKASSIGTSGGIPEPSEASTHSHTHSHGDDKSTSSSTATSTTKNATTTTTAAGGVVDEEGVVSHYQLIKLMTTFCVGRSVMEWVKLHRDGSNTSGGGGFDVLRHVDVRRLVQFGVIKGQLYRVHKYVVSKRYLAQLATGQVQVQGQIQAQVPQHRKGGGSSSSAAAAWPSSSNNNSNNNNGNNNAENDAENDKKMKMKIQKMKEKNGGGGGGGSGKAGGASSVENNNNNNNPLRKYLDGTHCFDQIITEQNMTDSEIMEKLKSFQAPAGDLTVFYR